MNHRPNFQKCFRSSEPLQFLQPPLLNKMWLWSLMDRINWHGLLLHADHHWSSKPNYHLSKTCQISLTLCCSIPNLLSHPPKQQHFVNMVMGVSVYYKSGIQYLQLQEIMDVIKNYSDQAHLRTFAFSTLFTFPAFTLFSERNSSISPSSSMNCWQLLVEKPQSQSILPSSLSLCLPAFGCFVLRLLFLLSRRQRLTLSHLSDVQLLSINGCHRPQVQVQVQSARIAIGTGRGLLAIFSHTTPTTYTWNTPYVTRNYTGFAQPRRENITQLLRQDLFFWVDFTFSQMAVAWLMCLCLLAFGLRPSVEAKPAGGKAEFKDIYLEATDQKPVSLQALNISQYSPKTFIDSSLNW